MTDYKDFYHTTNREQLAIKGKKTIHLFVKDTILRLLDAFYVLSLTINFINIVKLWHNDIGIDFPSNQLAELSFNEKIFAYVDIIKN